LLREEGGVAGRVLHDLGIELRRTEELVMELTEAATLPASPTSLDFTPDTKRALELAVEEARRMGHHYIGTEHLLLGLVRQSGGVGIEILKRLGISPEEVRRQTRRVLQESPVQNSAPQEPPESGRKAQQAAVNEVLAESAVVSHTRLFTLIQTLVMKVLDMIEQNKLSSTQGAELLRELLPEINLTPGERVQLASQFKRAEGAEKRHIHVTITDKNTEQSPVQISMGLEAALQNMDVLFSAILNNQTEALVFDNGDKQFRVEISIEDDKPQPDSSATE
jgi:ATP-dependent Clp protease ATP-binding subunit ClpA